jgi:DNA ligase-associated metallophosphoesterase
MKTGTIQIEDNSWVLSPERAAFWMQEKILVVADPHFGKAAAFRAHGIPIPGGTTRDDLNRLARLILRHRPEQLIILGDLMHARRGNTPALRQKIKAWRSRFPGLPIALIQGNHDRNAGRVPEEFQIDRIRKEERIGPFLFAHEPRTSNDLYVFAGHVHPCVRLFDIGKHRKSLPCFYFSENYAVLPAFGGFTGGQNIRPKKNDRLFLVAEDDIVEITQGGRVPEDQT